MLDLELKNSPSAITVPVGTILYFTVQKHVCQLILPFRPKIIYKWFLEIINFFSESLRPIGLDNKSNKGESKNAIHLP